MISNLISNNIEMKRIFLLTCIFGLISSSSSQLTEWVQVDKILPEGVQLFSSTVQDWPSLSAWLVTADLSTFRIKNGWDFAAALSSNSSVHLSTVREFSDDFGSVIATNGGFFGKANGIGSSYSLAVSKSKLLSPNIASIHRSDQEYFPTRCSFGIDQTHTADAFWIYNNNDSVMAYDTPSENLENCAPQPVPCADYPSNAKVWDLDFGVGGGPMLVFNSANVAVESYEAEVMWGSGVPGDFAAPRTAIGVGIPSLLAISTPQLLWIVVDGVDDATGLSLPDLANEFVKLGASSACNLDGGTSTQLVVDHDLINNPNGDKFERSVAAAVMMFKV